MYKIKALIFDVGGVLEIGKAPGLVQCGKSFKNVGVHEYIARKLKISVDQWFDSSDTAYAKSMENKLSERKVIEVLSRNLKVKAKKLVGIIVQAYRKGFVRNKELYKFAFDAKKQGYKIAILSDQWHLSKKALIEEKLMKRFDVVVISCDVGVRKPDKKIYQMTLRKLKLKPSECVLVDNQEWNTKPAERLKMKTVIYKNNKQTFKELNKLGIKVKK